MNTKKNETVAVAHTVDELRAIDTTNYCYTAKPVLEVLAEDFVDEESGEIQTIERTSIVFERGKLLTSDDFSELIFHLQCGNVKEIWLSNQQRRAMLVGGRRFGLWTVKVEGERKLKLLLRADSALAAYEVAKDYIELNYCGDFNVTSIKTFTDSIVIEPEEDIENRDISVDKLWYMVLVQAFQLVEDGEPLHLGTNQYVVFAENVECAKSIVDNWVVQQCVKKGESTDNIVLKTMSASTVSCSVVVPAEFCFAYTEKEDSNNESC